MRAKGAALLQVLEQSIVVIALGCVALFPPPVMASGLTRDDDGWTQFEPDASSRIVYVSSSAGNDATGQVYAPDNPSVGRDPFRPVGAIMPFDTMAAALRNAREGEPDWVLLKKGDEWKEDMGRLPSGRDAASPFLLSAYGDAAARPLLRVGGKSTLRSTFSNKNGFHDIAIVGLEFYADILDPNSRRYDAVASKEAGIEWALYLSGSGKMGRGLLFEDCCMRYLFLGFMAHDGAILEVAMRRCLVLDAYHRVGHCQGIYSHCASVLLEENIFDHNGWLLQGRNKSKPDSKGARASDGGATQFNHNTYFCGARDTVFRGNMFLRAASAGTKWTANDGPASSRNVTIDDNLFVEGEVGISMGGNVGGPLRFKNITVTSNVLMHVGRARPTDRDLGWGIWISDWDGGRVSGNLLIHQQSEDVRNVYGIHLTRHATTQGAPGQRTIQYCRHVRIEDNIIYGLMNGRGVIFSHCEGLFDVSFAGNLVQLPDIQSRAVRMDTPTPELAFAHNTYFSGRTPGEWFTLGEREVGFNAWTRDCRETGSIEKEIRFRDPARSVETYNASLGGKPTLEDFIEEARRQSKANWRNAYTAAAVNAYVREGFTRVTGEDDISLP